MRERVERKGCRMWYKVDELSKCMLTIALSMSRNDSKAMSISSLSFDSPPSPWAGPRLWILCVAARE